jgi:hypothetical protein
MRAFTTTELSRMQGGQEEAMMDTCVIFHYLDGVTDKYGVPVPTFIEGSVSECGLDPDPKPEWNAPAAGGDQTQVQAGEARIRLPIDTRIGNKDRVRITHRFGELLDIALDYELTSELRQGPSGLVASCRVVTHG